MNDRALHIRFFYKMSEVAMQTNVMVTVTEEYMRDIFETIGDAIHQRIFLEDLAAKYNAQLEELTKVKEELKVAKEANKLEAIYAKIFLENLMTNKKGDIHEVAAVAEDIVKMLTKRKGEDNEVKAKKAKAEK